MPVPQGGPVRLRSVLRSQVWDRAEGKRIRRAFDNQGEAKGWHRDAVIALRRGRQVEGKSKATLQAVCEDFLEQARTRTALNRSGDPYKPPAIRGYEQTLRKHVWPTLGESPSGYLPRPIWATAMYAGLRRGELRALRFGSIDLGGGLIRVERGWDDIEGEIPTKNRSNRRVPIPSVLRDHLSDVAGSSEALAFGQTPSDAFRPQELSKRADDAWEAHNLKRITLHECRHTYASLMIAAGCNAKALSTYMGHANIAITLDRYGHLFPGNEDQAAGLLETYLERSIKRLPRTRDAHSARSRSTTARAA